MGAAFLLLPTVASRCTSETSASFPNSKADESLGHYIRVNTAINNPPQPASEARGVKSGYPTSGGPPLVVLGRQSRDHGKHIRMVIASAAHRAVVPKFYWTGRLQAILFLTPNHHEAH